GVISTGRIAGAFTKALADSRTGELLAVASRTQEAADKFGDEYNVPRRYGNYQALLEDPDVQAVYIATPHPMHAEWAVKAVRGSGGYAVCVSDEEILMAMRELGRGAGVYAEPAGAAGWAGVRVARARGLISARETAAVLITGTGLKDSAAAERAVALRGEGAHERRGG
ncbi:MAG: pyridoxal-phosphate dependent enzyme, partial [bacterium]|nr:pyridoxal-phosphate dependent enzyme [bacterium]